MNKGTVLVLLSCLLVFASAKRTEQEYKAEWARFLVQHSPLYSTQQEHARRYAVFKNNVDFIDNHNSLNKSFSVAINKFADLTSEEFAAAYLGKRININDIEREATPFVVSDLPASVDWRTKNAVTHVKNQGQCGSCWSFSTTGSIEGCVAIATGHLVSLSEQNLVDCSTTQGNNGCDGGLMDYGFQYVIANKGIDTETSYPYTAQDGRCHYNPANCGAIISGYKDVLSGSESELQVSVAAAPTSVAIDASQSSFQFYSSGVYYEPACSSTQLDHGVLAVGYGTDSGSDFWLVKNSWGSDWGMNGYIEMARNRNNNCGIATMASFPTGCNLCQ